MPIYEYQCQKCGEQLEALQKMSDAPLVDCPACGAPELKKKVSASAFRLKGGGWYETDFKTGNKKNLHGAAESAASGDGAAAAKGAEAKQDSKPGGKKDSTPESKKTA
jgi:putative FmdB family regulatory protein